MSESRANEENNSSRNWQDLHQDLGDTILDKLVHLSDHIRFGAVSKSWHSIAMDEKQKRSATMRKQPLMLLTATHERFYSSKCLSSFSYFKPYSIRESKFYNHELKVPRGNLCFGSAYGWLIIETLDSSILLFNPFTEKSIQITDVDLFHFFTKGILSCDPSTCPDDFVLAVLLHGKVVNFIRAGEKFWNSVQVDTDDVRDIVFQKGLLWAVCADEKLIAIDYKRSNNGRHQCDPSRVEIVRGRSMDGVDVRGLCMYLVADLKGDLLLVKRFFDYPRRGGIHVYKLQSKKNNPSSMKEMEWVEINDLGKNNALFLSGTHCCCISVSSLPHLKQNCIYFQQSIITDSWDCRNGSYIQVFDLSDRTMSRFDGFEGVEGGEDVLVFPALLSPTLS